MENQNQNPADVALTDERIAALCTEYLDLRELKDIYAENGMRDEEGTDKRDRQNVREMKSRMATIRDTVPDFWAHLDAARPTAT